MSTIYLVGLGPGDPQALTLRALKVLKTVKWVYLRTARHPGLQLLTRHQIRYTTLDYLYENSNTFEETYQKIAYLVMNAARKKGAVAYAVPGSPLFAEKAVEIILKKAPAIGIRCRVIPSVSFVDAMAAEMNLPQDEEVAVVDALQLDKLLDHPEKHLLIMQAYNNLIASRVKLELGSIYPDDHPVTAIRGAGLASGKKTVTVPLYKMDRVPFTDHLTTFYLPPVVPHGLTDFLRVMRQLRSEEGCPWDREQDHHTLKPYLLEEAYEVLGAINSGSAKDLCEELGDLLLQVVFHCQIASENGTFTFYNIVDGITEKLIRRHPHVFGSATATTAGDVIKSWQQIKKDEKKERTSLFTLENYLPALLRAQKLQRQASSAGFDWPDDKGAWQKVAEELKELIDAYNQQDQAKIVEEFGDLLFAAVNVSRFLNVDAEQALAGSTEKFYKRLRYVEQMAEAEGRGISGYSLLKLDEWWEEAKKQ
jgi:tetrapyrrole methylase family protein/MazG family protein